MMERSVGSGSLPEVRGLDRSGHISELTFDRLRDDPPAARGELHQNALLHLASCERCRAAQVALEAADLALPTLVPRVSRPRRNWTRWLPAAAIPLALAAVAFLVTRLPEGSDKAPPGEGLVRKSAAFDFEVFVHDGAKSRLVQSGDHVHPGDRMSFRVVLRAPGHLLVVGADEAGQTYPCWPEGAARSEPRGPTDGPEVLPVALRFDDILGHEHLVGIFCPEPFMISELATSQLLMHDGDLLADFRRAHPECSVRKVMLEKVAPL